MKRIFLCVLTVLVIISNAYAAGDYVDKKYQCDISYDLASQNKLSTVQIVGAISDRTDCYIDVINFIIDDLYSENDIDMKKNAITYIDVSGEMVGFIGRPDSCYPDCGTVIAIDSATARFDAAEQYLDNLLSGVNQ